MEKPNDPKVTIKKALQTYKSLRSIGIGVSDICKLINWTYAKEFASKSGLLWLQIAVTALSAVCLLAPGGDKFVDAIVAEVDKEIV